MGFCTSTLCLIPSKMKDKRNKPNLDWLVPKSFARKKKGKFQNSNSVLSHFKISAFRLMYMLSFHSEAYSYCELPFCPPGGTITSSIYHYIIFNRGVVVIIYMHLTYMWLFWNSMDCVQTQYPTGRNLFKKFYPMIALLGLSMSWNSR